MNNIVAIVGRPNVGKSTLFNRLIGERKSIIDDISGVTRDRLYGYSIWNGKKFMVVDTGGFVTDSDDVFESAIRDQVEIAIEEASIILFLVDVTTGITDLDMDIASRLRAKVGEKKVILAVNKVDNNKRELEVAEFWGLGLDTPHPISATSGAGTGDLLDHLVEQLPEEEKDQSDLPKIAIIGQPNVGKSSLTNALLGEERNIVTDIAGTTRDSIHSVFKKFGQEILLIDTAGMRKKARVHEDLEFYSVMRAIRAIEEADVCLLLIDAEEGIENQDVRLAWLAHKRHKGLVVAVNKWDLVEKETNTARDMTHYIQERLAPFSDVPVIFTSVLEKQRILKVIELCMEVYEKRKKIIPTSTLNKVMLKAIERKTPPSHRGLHIKIKYVTQIRASHPVFAFFCNHPKHVVDSYRHYLENQLRKNFDFTGVPISIFFRDK
ncbi:MAG: ribosome biogenesis GTPase Der [Saprospirales bacterium]|nr:MAG: ribosome biogenesis GTPase Der [Saprospirales bacterium]